VASFNVHEPVVQAAVIEAAARLAVASGATVERTAVIAKELLERLANRPADAPYADIR